MSHSRNMRTGTTTIDVRENTFRRYVLDRRTETLDTTYRTVRWKVSAGYGVKREKYEYEDLRRVAEERKISLAEAEALLGNALTPGSRRKNTAGEQRMRPLHSVQNRGDIHD